MYNFWVSIAIGTVVWSSVMRVDAIPEVIYLGKFVIQK